MIYGYNLYGLKVNTSFKIDGFPYRDKYVRPNAVVKFAPVTEPPKGLPKTIYKPYSIFNKEFYYLNIPSIAKYYINEGDQVTIELKDKQMRKEAIVFFKDTILSVLLIKNKCFPIKASAVRAKDGVYLLCSHQREGKSAIAAKLCLSGYQFLNDDKSILTWDNQKKVFTTKSYSPEVELWKNVLPIFKNHPTKFKKKQIRKNIEKYRIDFGKKVCKQKLPVKAIFVLHAENEKIKPQIEAIKGFKKLEIVKNNIHMAHLIDIIGISQDFFQLNTLISAHLPIIKINRSKIMRINAFAKFIDNEICTKTTFS